jgi:hypothetical protein
LHNSKGADHRLVQTLGLRQILIRHQQQGRNPLEARPGYIPMLVFIGPYQILSQSDRRPHRRGYQVAELGTPSDSDPQ